MNHFLAIFSHESRKFFGNDKAVFVVYGVLILLWSGLFVSSVRENSQVLAPMWLMTFSVIAVTNFAQSVFISERSSGAWEVVLSAGFSRSALVVAKVSFVALGAVVMGLSCLGVGWLGLLLFSPYSADADNLMAAVSVALYCCTALFNALFSALLTVYLPNPRLVHFVNFAVIALIMAVYYAFAAIYALSSWYLAGLLVLLSLILVPLVVRGFESERIVRPVNL
jgi:ABC-type Na+ efflux pump permease subunit